MYWNTEYKMGWVESLNLSKSNWIISWISCMSKCVWTWYDIYNDLSYHSNKFYKFQNWISKGCRLGLNDYCAFKKFEIRFRLLSFLFSPCIPSIQSYKHQNKKQTGNLQRTFLTRESTRYHNINYKYFSNMRIIKKKIVREIIW